MLASDTPSGQVQSVSKLSSTFGSICFAFCRTTARIVWPVCMAHFVRNQWDTIPNQVDELLLSTVCSMSPSMYDPTSTSLIKSFHSIIVFSTL